MVDVYLNDQFIGNVANREEFISSVKEKRWENKLPGTLNIRYDQGYDEILIETASGRARRPLIRVKDGSLLLTKEIMEKLTTNELSWDDLVSQGIIEYLDAAEEEDSYIALNEELLTKDHTHIEISPVVLLGFVTSLIPYSNYGSSSRLIRGSKIQKQSLGLYASNFLIRMDTDVSVLHYPQMPVVKSFMHDVTNYDKHPSGQNITIALM